MAIVSSTKYVITSVRIQTLPYEANWDEYEEVYVSERTSLKDRKRTDVRKCTSNVRNHF